MMRQVGTVEKTKRLGYQTNGPFCFQCQLGRESKKKQRNGGLKANGTWPAAFYSTAYNRMR